MITTAPSRSSEFDDAVLALRDALLARALHLELSAAGAQDLVQDTLERALRCSSRFQWGTNLRAWLQTLMFNIFVDRYRQRSHETSLEPLAGDYLAAAEPDPEPEWRSIEPAVVQEAFAGLPPALRRACELRFELGMGYEEIARRLAVPIGTVGTRLLRARRHLRRVLERQLENPAACAG
jgi:RNA polymerase sigma-70 factor (ECF subfamily)